jgi:GT2 family glycosyltransferase
MSNQLIIIPTYISSQQHFDLLDKCLSTIKKTTDSAEILLVDDCSPGFGSENTDHSKKLSEKYKTQYFRNKENSGFSKTVNVGLKKALNEGKDAILVNQDIEFIETNWIPLLESSDEYVSGALLLYPNKIIQHAGIYFSQITRNFDHRYKGCIENQPEAQKPYYCPVTGALQYIKNECLQDVGLYDERFFLGYEDVDYCIRVIKSGYKCFYNPKVKAIHHESVIRGTVNIYEQNQSYFDFVRKYKNVPFDDVAPTMLERFM